MFTNMLRPSRRHVHERISQNEDANNANNNNNNNSDSNNSNHNGDDNITNGQRSSSGPTIVVLGNDDNQHYDLNLTEEGAAADGGDAEALPQPTTAASVNTNASNPNNNDSFNLESNGISNTENLEQPATNSSSSSSADEEDITLQHPNQTTNPFLVSHQNEREIRYRRQSTCTLLILFFLTRLWIEAIMEKDAGLIFLSVMGSTWTYRWFVNRREVEEEYDRQIAEERNGTGVTGSSTTDGNAVDGEGNGADAAVDFDPDLGLMSFQAQMALAILESQRQMFENGGYGNERNSSEDGPGVTNEAKEKWKSYDWGDNAEETAKLAGMNRSASMEAIKRTGSGSNYGSTSTIDLAEDEQDQEENKTLENLSLSKLESGGGGSSFDDDDDEPSCSICLCEYERGEKVFRLPCNHLYHASCLNSWTENHIRCPLCNYNLMEGFEQPASVQQQARQHAEEQRAFRNMALSTLGRRIRTRRSMSRRATRASAAAAMVAAAEDSIV